MLYFEYILVMNEKQELLKKLNIEDFIWVIYLLIIGLSFVSNYFERKYIKYDDINSKNKYRVLNITIFGIAVLIYLYFAYDNYKDVNNLNDKDSNNKINFTYLSFLGTLLALISGLIFFYIAVNDEELETEISFS